MHNKRKLLFCIITSPKEASIMNSEEIVKLTGYNIHYEYRELKSVQDASVIKYMERTKSLCAPIAKTFNDDKNTECLIRSYLALKYILAATVLGTSAQYAEAQNLKVTLPYLNYYMMFHCSRAFIFTLPCTDWNDKNMINMSHQKTINITASKLGKLDIDEKTKYLNRISMAKDQRELFSYSFPATGLNMLGNDLIEVEDAIQTARLLTDLAQANLACLAASIEKHSSASFGISDDERLWLLMTYETNIAQLIDDDDWHRVGYFCRKYTAPCDLYSLAREGLVEDFFGAWADDDAGDGYDPDEDWQLLLDFC